MSVLWRLDRLAAAAVEPDGVVACGRWLELLLRNILAVKTEISAVDVNFAHVITVIHTSTVYDTQLV